MVIRMKHVKINHVILPCQYGNQLKIVNILKERGSRDIETIASCNQSRLTHWDLSLSKFNF